MFAWHVARRVLRIAVAVEWQIAIDVRDARTDAKVPVDEVAAEDVVDGARDGLSVVRVVIERQTDMNVAVGAAEGQRSRRRARSGRSARRDRDAHAGARAEQ